MIVDCVSDLHGDYPELEGGDLLILAGDYLARDTLPKLANFLAWIKGLPYTHKVMIAGNHDCLMASMYPTTQAEADDFREMQEFLKENDEDHEEEHFHYLCDSGITLVVDGKTLKIWGSPWSKSFKGMNKDCMAFTKKTDKELAEKWALIPDDTDILITHTPPFGILDAIEMEDGSSFHLGSKSLFERLQKKHSPKLHVFGHIHEWGGNKVVFKRPGYGTENNTICINAAYVNERYRPVNKPMRVTL